MATKSINAKSKRFDVRVPHQVAESVELLKSDGESTGQFVVTALENEIKRRQRKLAKEEPRG
ncbi:YlcI/YnfO family protein [Enterobacter sp. C2]|uniref:YlcI/YnfO family protein n=1 Tax=Enterobacter sp. C2 TaxID=2870346 RepID=UPI001CA3D994|nr:YlcI/YnfO family protein [Enterobacter sp. C2]